jgi:hypothetical protein
MLVTGNVLLVSGLLTVLVIQPLLDTKKKYTVLRNHNYLYEFIISVCTL